MLFRSSRSSSQPTPTLPPARLAVGPWLNSVFMGCGYYFLLRTQALSRAISTAKQSFQVAQTSQDRGGLDSDRQGCARSPPKEDLPCLLCCRVQSCCIRMEGRVPPHILQDIWAGGRALSQTPTPGLPVDPWGRASRGQPASPAAQDARSQCLANKPSLQPMLSPAAGAFVPESPGVL